MGAALGGDQSKTRVAGNHADHTGARLGGVEPRDGASFSAAVRAGGRKRGPAYGRMPVREADHAELGRLLRPGPEQRWRRGREGSREARRGGACGPCGASARGRQEGNPGDQAFERSSTVSRQRVVWRGRIEEDVISSFFFTSVFQL
jgi:hypothetical protein